MIGVTRLAALLAQLDPQEIERLRSGFVRPGGEGDSTALWILVAAVAAIIIYALVFSRRKTSGPAKVDYLAHATQLLGLSPQDLEDLRTLEGRGRVRQPVRLLLSPANLADGITAAERWALDPQLRARITDLCLRVFEQPLPAPPPAEAVEHRPE
jgi:hypothetical protein